MQERCFKPHDSVTVAEAPGVDYNQLDAFIGEDGFFSMIFDFKAADLDVASGSEWFKTVKWSPKDLFDKLKHLNSLSKKLVGEHPLLKTMTRIEQLASI